MWLKTGAPGKKQHKTFNGCCGQGMHGIPQYFSSKTHRCLATGPSCRLQHDGPYAAADVQELVLRREVAVAEHLIHRGLEDGAVPVDRKKEKKDVS